MNHQEVWEQETATSQKEQLWLIYAKKIENALGHSLDGDEWADGYSLDGAYDHFLRGTKASEYLAEIRENKKRITGLTL